MILKPFQEIVGTVTGVEVKDGYIVLFFAMEQEIEIPTAAISPDLLDRVIGKRIGLFNNSDDYKIREIKKTERGKRK